MRLIASVSPGEMRVVAWDGSLRDYAIWRPGAPDGVGALHRGRVIARVPAMAGAFVALAGSEGFLPESEGTATEGSVLGVRITRAAQGGKGPRLSARLEAADSALIGSGPPCLVRAGPDALARLRALYPDAPVTTTEHDFEDAIEAAVEALAEPIAVLPGGARMQVSPTPALVAIDLDLAAASGEKGGKSATQLAANRALMPALARQIRLRNLSGAILVDFAGLPIRKRAGLGQALAESLAGDPLAPRLLGFTGLGLAEILRPRIHPPLHEMLAGPHAAGLAALRRLAADLAATPWHNPALRAAPDVATALRGDTAALEALAHRAGRPLLLTEDRSLQPGTWSLETHA